jgi:CheY-like chemotaxis protein
MRLQGDCTAQNGVVTNLTISMQPTSTRPHKILVVDDDARIRDLLKRYLTQEGFEVLLAEDGKSLTRVMLRETAELIVLDLMMPGEDGLSICRRLRAANDQTPIIMLTAKGEDIDRIVGLEVGADDYPSTRASCWPVSTRCCAVARFRKFLARHPAKTKWCISGVSNLIWVPARCIKA